jgi:DNA repair photolyase
MVREITAKVLLSSVHQPDSWFGLKYNMNLYRGCQHGCIYCDSRSECYGIDDFSDIQVKVNAIELLRNELSRKRIRGTIGTGSMNDPYMPLEAQRQLTRQALQVIGEFRFPVHILTKSSLVLRDLDLLQEISKVFAAVSFTITCADDELGRKIEPGASPVSQRFAALESLAKQRLNTGVLLMPVLPYLEDNEENIRSIVCLAKSHGAGYILASFGMTLRDRQRAYYYQHLDRHFPGIRPHYERQFGEQYFAPAQQAKALEKYFNECCQEQEIATHMPMYAPQSVKQLSLALFESDRKS